MKFRILLFLFVPAALISAQVNYTINCSETASSVDEYQLLFESMLPLFQGFIGYPESEISLPVNIYGSPVLFSQQLEIESAGSRPPYQIDGDGADIHPPILNIYEIDGLPDLRETARLASLQYCRSVIPGLPPWFELGMAYYLENMNLTEDGSSLYPRFNTDALDYFKTNIFESFDPEELITNLDYNTDLANQAAGSWALFTFLLHTEESLYSRFLWETIASSRHSSYSTYLEKNLPGNSFKNDFNRFFTSTMPSRTEQYKTILQLYNESDNESLAAAARDLASNEKTEAVGRYYLGLISYNKGNFQQAFDYFDFVCRNSPEKAEAWYSASLALQQLGKSRESREYREKAAELSPDRFPL